MRNILSIIMIIAGIGAIVFFGVPHYDNVSALGEEQQVLDSALANARKLEETRVQLLEEYNSFDQQSLRRLETMIPSNIDNVKLIIEIDALANQYGLPLQNVTVAESENTSDVQVIEDTTADFGIVQLQFSVRGNYAQFVQFLAQLERSLRLIDVKNLEFQSTNEENIYQYAFTVDTYWLK